MKPCEWIYLQSQLIEKLKTEIPRKILSCVIPRKNTSTWPPSSRTGMCYVMTRGKRSWGWMWLNCRRQNGAQNRNPIMKTTILWIKFCYKCINTNYIWSRQEAGLVTCVVVHRTQYVSDNPSPHANPPTHTPVWPLFRVFQYFGQYFFLVYVVVLELNTIISYFCRDSFHKRPLIHICFVLTRIALVEQRWRCGAGCDWDCCCHCVEASDCIRILNKIVWMMVNTDILSDIVIGV